MKSTQNHLTLALTKSRVMGIGQGTSLPSTTKWVPSGGNQKGPEEGITMSLSNIIAIITLITTTAMGLPNMIVTAITLYRTLKPPPPPSTTNKQSPGVWARAGGPAPTPQEHQEGTR